MTTRKPFDPNLVPEAPGAAPKSSASRTLTVSQLTAMVKTAIEDALPTTLHIVGEISNFKRHGSGHLYFTLKDRSSELSCVMWRSAAGRLKFEPDDGLEVVCTGAIEVFERAGRYQFYVRKIEPRGVGALELAFRQFHERLSGEGLFDDRHKKPLPTYPTRIVLVTSPTGAAVADMIRTIERRYPCVHVLVYPVRVQGDGASEEVADAIRQVNFRATDLGGVDVMIVGRGGGSLEDLWAFNEERVARAIFASQIPIISAVGHEVDVSIADLVADVRAATPTAAAELAVPVLDDVLDDLKARQVGLEQWVSRRVETGNARLDNILVRPPFREPLRIVNMREQAVDEIAMTMERSVTARMAEDRRSLDRLMQVVSRIHPQRQLLRTAHRLHDAEDRLRVTAAARMTRERDRTTAATQRLERNSPAHTLEARRASLRAVNDALRAGTRHRLALAIQSVRRMDDLLTAMSHKRILSRGFTITRKTKGRGLVRSPEEVKDGDRLLTETSDGEFESEVVNLRQLELFDE